MRDEDDDVGDEGRNDAGQEHRCRRSMTAGVQSACRTRNATVCRIRAAPLSYVIVDYKSDDRRALTWTQRTRPPVFSRASRTLLRGGATQVVTFLSVTKNERVRGPPHPRNSPIR